MAILSVKPMRPEDGSQSAAFTNTGNNRVRSFMVITNDLNDFPDNIAVASHGGFEIPAIGSADPQNSRRIARGITPIPRGGNEDDGYAFEVQVSYDTSSTFAGIAADSFDYEPDPTLRLPEVQWSFLKEPVVARFARRRWNGTAWVDGIWTTVAREGGGPPSRVFSSIPYANSAGQPFDPPPMSYELTIVGVLERWERSWNGLAALQYMLDGGAVNSDSWLGFAPGMVRFENITATRRIEAGSLLYRVRYELHIREHWLDVYPDDGYGKIEDGKLVEIVDENGVPAGAPVRLDGTGQPLADQQDDPTVYRVFDRHPHLPFDVWNLA